MTKMVGGVMRIDRECLWKVFNIESTDRTSFLRRTFNNVEGLSFVWSHDQMVNQNFNQ